MMDPNTYDLSKDAQNCYDHKYPLIVDFGFQPVKSAIDFVLQSAKHNFQIVLGDWLLLGAHDKSPMKRPSGAWVVPSSLDWCGASPITSPFHPRTICHCRY